MAQIMAMLFSSRSRSLLCVAMLLAASSASASNQQPMGGDVQHAQVTADPLVVEHYKQEFEGWSWSRQFPINTANTWCSECDQAPECCPMGGWFVVPGPHTTSQPVSTSTQITTTALQTATFTQSNKCPLDCGGTSTPSLPAPTSWNKLALPTTIQNATPSREIIFRESRTKTAALPTNSAKPLPALLAEPSDQDPKDITSTYYNFALEGHHPFAIPLILQDESKNPTTILATANTQLIDSFISIPLLSQLNLTSYINQLPSPQQSSLAPLIQYLGTPLSLRGSISIDLLAGKNDRRLSNEPFLVFDFEPVASQSSGPLLMDTVVGIDFLNRAHALRISDEYVGADVGAREGLGVVVQRVFAPDTAEGREEQSEL